MEPIEPHPPIVFDESGAPLSTLYGDVFRSRSGARAEAREVFVEGCELPERWRDARLPGAGIAQPFAVLELGFGAGVNFLEALAAWREARAHGMRLHFVSVEAHPLSRDDLVRIHAALGIESADAERLRAGWPLALPGLHSIGFDDADAVLTLCIGDAARIVPKLRMAADAIFLDGFAPARNPAMWSESLLRALGRLARPDAPFATWTAAAGVRDALVAAGFEVERVAGHAGKRHRLRGRYAPRWRRFPAPDTPRRWPSRDVLVVGAGFAGAATAAGFAQSGWNVTVLEALPHAAAAGSGSGQPLAADHLHLSIDDNVLARLTRAASGMRDAFALGPPDGKLVLDIDDEQGEGQARMLHTLGFPDGFARHVDADEAGMLAGVALPRGALWLPGAHVEDPHRLVAHWLAHERIVLRTGVRVERLVQDEVGWTALDAHGVPLANAAVVVLANAADAIRLGGFASIPLRPMRGQSTWLPGSCLPGLRRAVSGLAWAAPVDGRILAGATFESGDSLELSVQADASNVRRLARMLSVDRARAQTRAAEWALAARSASIGVRWASPDRIALIGEMPDEHRARTDAARLSKDARLPLPRARGLYGAFGFGARGVLWACLAARCLPALADGSPAPIEADLLRAIDPARFLRRRLRAGKAI